MSARSVISSSHIDTHLFLFCLLVFFQSGGREGEDEQHGERAHPGQQGPRRAHRGRVCGAPQTTEDLKEPKRRRGVLSPLYVIIQSLFSTRSLVVLKGRLRAFYLPVPLLSLLIRPLWNDIFQSRLSSSVHRLLTVSLCLRLSGLSSLAFISPAHTESQLILIMWSGAFSHIHDKLVEKEKGETVSNSLLQSFLCRELYTYNFDNKKNLFLICVVISEDVFLLGECFSSSVSSPNLICPSVKSVEGSKDSRYEIITAIATAGQTRSISTGINALNKGQERRRFLYHVLNQMFCFQVTAPLHSWVKVEAIRRSETGNMFVTSPWRRRRWRPGPAR